MKTTLHTMRYILLAAIIVLAPQLVFSQKTQAPNPYFWENVFGQLVLIGGLVVLAAAFITIVRLFSMLVRLQEIQLLREKGLPEVAAHYAEPERSLWSRLWEKMQGAVPVAKEKEILFEHEYDGIRELDNSLPPWWLWLFYISIAISGVYFYVYHISGKGLSSKERYELQMETAKKEVDEYLSKQADVVDETNASLLTDEASLAAGKEIYTSLCVVCHGPAGEGGVGPNFTDQYWIHGGDIKDLFKTIKYGVPEKGMISWNAQLKPTDMQKVASYILSMQGTNPPNAKAPQGDLWVPPGEAMLRDSTAQ